MYWCTCFGFMNDVRSLTPPAKVTPVFISAAVGKGGTNASKDVK